MAKLMLFVFFLFLVLFIIILHIVRQAKGYTNSMNANTCVDPGRFNLKAQFACLCSSLDPMHAGLPTIVHALIQLL